MRDDMDRLASSRREFFFNKDGVVDMDRVLVFLFEYNAFINHTPKKFQQIVDDVMKL